MTARKPFLVTSAEIASMDEVAVSHPLNPKAEAHYRPLSHLVGLERVGFHRVRLRPGREANEYHTHRVEEEFFYILSGRGTALIDGKRCAIGAGDFMGFTTPSVAHLILNDSEDDLVYLVGGERQPFEFAEYPRLEKSLVRQGGDAWFVDNAALDEYVWGETADKPVAADKPFLVQADRIRSMEQGVFVHPLNPESESHYRSLSHMVDLTRVGFHLVRIPAGKEGAEYHAHRVEEEFFYILSGHGVALVDGKEYAIGPEDFLGFATPSVPHLITNSSDDDLLYLVGGERRPYELVDFPRRGKFLVRHVQRRWYVDRDAFEKFDWRKRND